MLEMFHYVKIVAVN